MEVAWNLHARVAQVAGCDTRSGDAGRLSGGSRPGDDSGRRGHRRRECDDSVRPQRGHLLFDVCFGIRIGPAHWRTTRRADGEHALWDGRPQAGRSGPPPGDRRTGLGQSVSPRARALGGDPNGRPGGRQPLRQHRGIDRAGTFEGGNRRFLERTGVSPVAEFGNEHNFIWKRGDELLVGNSRGKRPGAVRMPEDGFNPHGTG